ncbi:MAG: Dabb family protein [Oscillospiraceae bacterium]
MVKHLIIWDLKDELSDSEKAEKANEIKQGLEGLKGQIDGLVDIKVQTDFLESSNGDMLLDSTFEDENALKGYQTNPKHLAVAKIVRANTKSRKCVDFEI